MKTIRLLTPLLLCTIFRPAMAAADFQYYVMPVSSITGISQSALKSGQTGPKYGGMINAQYADTFFDDGVQRSLIQSFQQEVVKQFSTSVIGPNQVGTSRSGKYAFQPFGQAQCKPTFTANYKDVFAIAVGISRLSTYFNTYSDFTQVLVPVTYTIRFVKMNGASVVFSKSETIYTEMTATTKEFFKPGTQEMTPAIAQKLKAAILSDGLSMVQRQVDMAAKNFSPKQSEVAVVARDGEYIVFDRGSEVGFSSGEDFDAINAKGEEFSFSVKYATDRLAVAIASDFTPEIKQATNRLREGDKVAFSFTKQGRDDAKPSVLAIQYASRDGKPLTEKQIQDNALMSIVSDDIGFSAPFNLIKYDADFARLKEQIKSEANCEATMYRDMPGFADNSTKPSNNPDFYLKIDTYNSPAFTAVGEGGAVTKSFFNDAVTFSLIDRSSIVNQVFLGTNLYELMRTGGKGLSEEQAREVNLKNSALIASKSMLAGFASSNKSVAIKSVAGGTVTLAETLPVDLFPQARLVRPLKFGKLNKQIMLPISNDVAQLVKPTSDTKTIELKGELKITDHLTLGTLDPNNKHLQQCESSKQSRFLAPALKHASSAEEIIGKVVGSKAKGYNMVETNPAYLDSIELALRDGFFSSSNVVRNSDSPYCLLPLELQQLPKNDCVGSKCNGTANVGSGIRIFEGGTKIAESVQGARFDFSDIDNNAVSQFVGLKAFEHQINSISQHKSKLN
jgi:hypothetical protein